MAEVHIWMKRFNQSTALIDHGRLCESTHPVDGKQCEGSGNHLGSHAHSMRVGGIAVQWPNERGHRPLPVMVMEAAHSVVLERGW